MPHYFFHIRNGLNHQDPEGADLGGIPQARAAAMGILGKMLAYDTEAFWEQGDWELTATNADGIILFSLWLSAHDAPVLVGFGQEDDPTGR